MWNNIVNVCRYFVLGVVVVMIAISLIITSFWIIKRYEDYQQLSGQQALSSCKNEGIPVLKADMTTLDRCILLKNLPSGAVITINIR